MDREKTAKLFVYGTLKRGQLRGAMWPRAAVSICSAVVRGELWDLGSYPGLTIGTDWCLGELWSIAIDDLSVTLSVLDEIEGYCEEADSGLYLRRTIPVWYADSLSSGISSSGISHSGISSAGSGIACEAQTYLYEHPSRLRTARKIQPWMQCPFAIPGDSLVACWPDSSSRVPLWVGDEVDPS
jgi:gamma-glutamylcyclotransferase (GGCT)/AIG2-like uncharacterized protein YtfP